MKDVKATQQQMKDATERLEKDKKKLDDRLTTLTAIMDKAAKVCSTALKAGALLMVSAGQRGFSKRNQSFTGSNQRVEKACIARIFELASQCLDIRPCRPRFVTKVVSNT